jgi:hypothetical protein
VLRGHKEGADPLGDGALRLDAGTGFEPVTFRL